MDREAQVIPVWFDARGMLYLESEVEKYRSIIVGSGDCKNRYQLEKYLKGWGMYEEFKGRKK